jgi:hypothetical protein
MSLAHGKHLLQLNHNARTRPQPNFIDLYVATTFDDGDGTLEGAGEDEEAARGKQDFTPPSLKATLILNDRVFMTINHSRAIPRACARNRWSARVSNVGQASGVSTSHRETCRRFYLKCAMYPCPPCCT